MVGESTEGGLFGGSVGVVGRVRLFLERPALCA